jgi:hypothetical protein
MQGSLLLHAGAQQRSMTQLQFFTDLEYRVTYVLLLHKTRIPDSWGVFSMMPNL